MKDSEFQKSLLRSPSKKDLVNGSSMTKKIHNWITKQIIRNTHERWRTE